MFVRISLSNKCLVLRVKSLHSVNLKRKNRSVNILYMTIIVIKNQVHFKDEMFKIHLCYAIKILKLKCVF